MTRRAFHLVLSPYLSLSLSISLPPLSLSVSLSLYLSLCVCVCVCERERERGEADVVLHSPNVACRGGVVSGEGEFLHGNVLRGGGGGRASGKGVLAFQIESVGNNQTW